MRARPLPGAPACMPVARILVASSKPSCAACAGTATPPATTWAASCAPLRAGPGGRLTDEEYSDDEDVSWKVRRAAAKCLATIVCAYPDRFADVYARACPALLARFREREESVKIDVFQAFIALLRQVRPPARGSNAAALAWQGCRSSGVRCAGERGGAAGGRRRRGGGLAAAPARGRARHRARGRAHAAREVGEGARQRLCAAQGAGGRAALRHQRLVRAAAAGRACGAQCAHAACGMSCAGRASSAARG